MVDCCNTLLKSNPDVTSVKLVARLSLLGWSSVHRDIQADTRVAMQNLHNKLETKLTPTLIDELSLDDAV
jgi:hypothetical protein